MGHNIENGCIKPDPQKVEAILKIEPPSNVGELRHFLGMVNYLMTFLPNLAEKTAPLRILLKKGYHWTWSEVQKKAWDSIKEAITSTPILAAFNRNSIIRVAADASSFGLGGFIEQMMDRQWKPVLFASRPMSPVERRYAQIEKEALALTWICETFSMYLLGNDFELMADHKPLVEILGNKPISDLSARLQSFRMRLACYKYKVTYTQGKTFYTPDFLSRNPLKTADVTEDILEDELFVQSIIESISCSDKKLNEIRAAQGSDESVKE